MAAPPTCLNCSLPAHPHWKIGRDYHSHCCFRCRKSEGEEHASYCAYHTYAYLSDRIVLRKCESRASDYTVNEECRPPWQKHSASDNRFYSKSRHSGDRASIPCRAPWDKSAAHEDESNNKSKRCRKSNEGLDQSPDVEFSLLQNYVLNRLQSHDDVEEWMDLFRAHNTLSGTDNLRNLVDVIVVYPLHLEAKARADYPEIHAIDCRNVECRSIRDMPGGEAFFVKGGRSCLLQEWILNQRATLRIVREALDFGIGGYRVLGFYCDHGKHRSAALCFLFKHLFAPTAIAYSYRERSVI